MIVKPTAKTSSKPLAVSSQSKSRWLLVATDGTCSATEYNKNYTDVDGRRKMNSSFVKRFYDSSRLGRNERIYLDGPEADGAAIPTIRDKAIEWLKPRIQVQDVAVKIVLVGHSRGAMVSVLIANWLNSQNKNVEYMGLYDAVDRTPNLSKASERARKGAIIGTGAGGLSGAASIAAVGFLTGIVSKEGMNAEVIPGNVLRVRHAVRDSSTGSRWWFGNTALTWVNGQNFTKEFRATHGAIGGAPPHECNSSWFGYFAPDSCWGWNRGITQAENTDHGEQAHRWIIEGAVKAGFRTNAG